MRIRFDSKILIWQMMGAEVVKTLRIKKIDANESIKGGHFFNSSVFLSAKSFPVVGWQLISKKPLTQIFFSIDNNVAVSGRAATFGSFDIHGEISSEELEWFIKEIIVELQDLKVIEIEVRNYPSYFRYADLVHACLEANHFKIRVSETDQFIEIGKQSFYEVARKDEVTRSDRCVELGLEFKISGIEKLPDVFALVESTLSRNGHSPSMTFEELNKAIITCPDNYILFTLWDKNILVAAVVSVVLSETVLYNFYHADHMDYRSHSALTYLIKHIYQYCQTNGFQILDLGISTENGVLNEGLFKFKQQRGAVPCTKSTYYLSLNTL